MPTLISAKCELQLELDCYPKSHSKDQQPWDAGDLYLIEEAKLGRFPAILNDQWGALTCFAAVKNSTFYSWSDSFCSQKATALNLKHLQLDTDLKSGQPCLPTNTDSLWIQCPKSFDQLHWWLTLAVEQLAPGTPVYLAGMAKHIPVKWLNWLETHSDQYQQLPIKKKARLICFELPTSIPPMKAEKGYLGPDNNEISALPGVFSRDHMDIGSRFFIDQLAKLPSITGNVLDLGCGNGLLSIAVLDFANKAKQQDSLNLILCDDSALALESANNNLVARNYKRAITHHTDALLGVTDRIDNLLCNPPFHTGNRISTAAAERMFQQAAQVLAKDGQLLVIANRHLGYAASLKRSFATVELLASDAKFVSYRCIQPHKQTKSTRPHKQTNTTIRASNKSRKKPNRKYV